MAVATTGFVLMTLMISGVSLRPLDPHAGPELVVPGGAHHPPNQVLAAALEDLQGRTEEIAKVDHVNPGRATASARCSTPA